MKTWDTSLSFLLGDSRKKVDPKMEHLISRERISAVAACGGESGS
jgi:hypothetical protein